VLASFGGIARFQDTYRLIFRELNGHFAAGVMVDMRAALYLTPEWLLERRAWFLGKNVAARYTFHEKRS